MNILTLLPPIFYAITAVFWTFLIIISFKRYKHYAKEQKLFSKLSLIVGFFAFTAVSANILFIYRYLATEHPQAMMWVDWAILALNTTAAIVTSVLFTHQSINDALTNIIHKIETLDELNEQKQEQLEVIQERDEFISFQQVLLDINQIMLSMADPNKMLDKVCYQFCQYEAFSVAWIGFAEYNADNLPISFFHDSAEPRFLSNDFVSVLDHNEPFANGPSSQAMLTCKSVLIEDTQSDLRFSQWHSRAKFSQIKSVLAIPMIAKDGDRPLGVLTLYSQNTLTSENAIIGILETITHTMITRFIRLNNQIKLEKLRQKNLNELNILKNILDTLPESIYYKDTQLRYIGANKRYLDSEEISSVADIIGKTDEQVYGDSTKSEVSAIEHRVINSGKDIIKQIEQKGSRYFAVDKMKFFNSNSTLMGIIGRSTDITTQHITHLDHIRNEKLYHDILDSIPDLAIQFFDADRRIVKWNVPNILMFGYSKEEAIGKKVEELIYPKELREDFIRKVDSWLTQNRPMLPVRMKLDTKNGKGVTVHGSYVLQNRLSKTPMFISVYIKS